MSKMRCHAVGRCGGDAQEKTNRNGDRYAKVSVAVDVETGKNAPPDAKPMWITLVGMGERRMAEVTVLAKGDSVEFMGDLRRSTYTRDGVTRESWSCFPDAVFSVPKPRPQQDPARQGPLDNTTDPNDDCPF